MCWKHKKIIKGYCMCGNILNCMSQLFQNSFNCVKKMYFAWKNNKSNKVVYPYLSNYDLWTFCVRNNIFLSNYTKISVTPFSVIIKQKLKKIYKKNFTKKWKENVTHWNEALNWKSINVFINFLSYENEYCNSSLLRQKCELNVNE